jgi:hypothetical protein
MEIATEPDIYSPCTDNLGNYIDQMPNFTQLPTGIRCPCGGRKDRYEKLGAFKNHTKTAIHQKWLDHLTANKTNYYKENEEYKSTIHTQKIIIARLEQELLVKSRTIDYLSSQLIVHMPREMTGSNQSTVNLLEFD